MPPAAPGPAWAAATASENSTAATPSLSRLSASTSSRSRPTTPVSLNVASTETGSVAAISTPNTVAAGQGQPSSSAIPAATTSAEMMTPAVASVRIGAASRRSSAQDRLRAASNSSGGSRALNSRCPVSAVPVWTCASASARPGGHQAHRVGHAQPPRRQRHQRRHDQQEDEAVNRHGI